MNGNVEDIIKNKQYFELSSEELGAVSEYAKTEEEFEEMKWFLTNVGEALQASKIDATASLKGRVMDHLTESKKQKESWINSVTVFLFPQEKRIYQKPAVQIFAAAAIILLGIFIVDPFANMEEDAGIAQDNQKSREIVSDSEEETESNEEAEAEVTDELVDDGVVNELETAREITESRDVSGPEMRAETWHADDPSMDRYETVVLVDKLESPEVDDIMTEDEEGEDDSEYYYWAAGTDGSVGDNNATVSRNKNMPAGTNDSIGNLSSKYRKDKDLQDEPGDVTVVANQEQIQEEVSTLGGYKRELDHKDAVKKQESSKNTSSDSRKGEGKKKSKRDEAIAFSDPGEKDEETERQNKGKSSGEATVVAEDPDTESKRTQAVASSDLKTNETANETVPGFTSTIDNPKEKEKLLLDDEAADTDDMSGKPAKTLDESKEEVIPKALHINSTKELKSLFYTIK